MSFRIKLFSAFILLAIFITTFSIYSFSNIIESKNVENQIVLIEDILDKKDKRVVHYMNNLKEILYGISNNHDFQKFSITGDEKENLQELFYTMMNTRHCITQIRFIDNGGNELVRVDKNKKTDNLQNKSNRYYFKKIKQQPINTVWYSKFDLNMENGKVEFPKKETIRIGLNLETGILIINLALDELRYIMRFYNYDMYLVDKDGHILMDANKKYCWSKYLNKNIKINDILGEKDLAFMKHENYINDKFVLKKLSFINDDEAYFIVKFPTSLSKTIANEMFPIYIIIAILTVVISIILAYSFSRPFSKVVAQKEEAYAILDKEVEKKTKQLKESLNIIDKYVIRSSTDLEGNIIYVSDAFCKVSGFTKDELIGKPHSIVRHPDMKDDVYKKMWETIKAGKIWIGKIKNKTKDGGFYWVKAYIEPKFDENGEIVAYTAIRRNITDQILLESLNRSLSEQVQEEVAKNTRQLELIQEEKIKSAKLTSIGALAAGITHEINTPLTYIKGNFEMMKYDIEEIEDDTLRTRMLVDTEKILDGINRIRNIVESMKEVSGSSLEKQEEVNIYSTVITALTIIYNTSKQVTKIYLNNEEFTPDIPKDRYTYNCKVQKQRIEQVWIVIIKNAIDELIKIASYEDRRLDIDFIIEDDIVSVKFQDNAGGIPKDMIDSVFDPFASSKVHGGMGIGLNIAKKIVEDNGGEIIANNENNGAVFEVKLPLQKV